MPVLITVKICRHGEAQICFECGRKKKMPDEIYEMHQYQLIRLLKVLSVFMLQTVFFSFVTLANSCFFFLRLMMVRRYRRIYLYDPANQQIQANRIQLIPILSYFSD